MPPRFEVYRAVSAQIHAIFAEFTRLGRVEAEGAPEQLRAGEAGLLQG